MRLLDVLVHRAPVGEDPITMNAGELFAVVQGLPMGLQVRLPAEGLAALGAGVDLHDAGVLLLAVAEQRALRLEQLPAIDAGQLLDRPVVLVVVGGQLAHGNELVAQAANVKLAPAGGGDGCQLCVRVVVVALHLHAEHGGVPACSWGDEAVGGDGCGGRGVLLLSTPLPGARAPRESSDLDRGRRPAIANLDFGDIYKLGGSSVR